MRSQVHKSIEELEEKYYPVVTDSTRLVRTITSLRKKRLDQFSTEDLRICICQNEGLPFLIPLAIDVLEKNMLAEGDCYEGDLLASVLSADKSFWYQNKSLWDTICNLYEKNRPILGSNNDHKQIKKMYAEFILLHPHA